MTVAELLVRCLDNEAVKYLFVVPGEEILDLLDALRESRIRVITVRHEQGAAFMADVHGRLTGMAGCCLSTLGPGATNLLTGIADATLDYAPVVAITGQASLDRMHKESHQYIDVMNALVPLEELDGLLSSAFVAKLFTGAKLVKGFNHLVAATLATDPVVEGGHSLGSAHLRGFVQEGAVIDHYVS